MGGKQCDKLMDLPRPPVASRGWPAPVLLLSVQDQRAAGQEGGADASRAAEEARQELHGPCPFPGVQGFQLCPAAGPGLPLFV